MEQLQRQAAAKLIQSAWRQFKYSQVKIGEDEHMILRESAIASPMKIYTRNKSIMRDNMKNRRRSRMVNVILRST